VVKSSSKIWATSVVDKNLPKVNNHPIGENLVTLLGKKIGEKINEKLSRSAFFDEKSIPFHERFPRSS
jgi:hypothetical protein